MNNKPVTNGAVLYWMGRDQRIDDNWAFIETYRTAVSRQVPLHVVFTLPKSHKQGTLRQYDFLLKGLQEVEGRCRELGVSFILLEGEVVSNIVEYCIQEAIGELFTDFNPLKQTRVLHMAVYEKVPVMAIEIDAHNIVPFFIASPKEEYAAYTFRPKVTKLLSTYLTQFPKLVPLTTNKSITLQIDWKKMEDSLEVDASVPPVSWLTPGSVAALAQTKLFIAQRFNGYAMRRNDPTVKGHSDLSPYLHFGQIGAQTVALLVREADAPAVDKEAFLEELIVRKELSDNYCYYNQNYGTVLGAHTWAQKTISEHKDDVREFIYTKKQFETGATHDELWNAMQSQLLLEGKLHGWCRMYWAKKILEWTPDVQTALTIALYLNDKYSLDGNDPNGVVGVMWSICGVHDRAWNQRSIFGKIRYMNYAGAKRKFPVSEYVRQYEKDSTLF